MSHHSHEPVVAAPRRHVSVQVVRDAGPGDVPQKDRSFAGAGEEQVAPGGEERPDGGVGVACAMVKEG